MRGFDVVPAGFRVPVELVFAAEARIGFPVVAVEVGFPVALVGLPVVPEELGLPTAVDVGLVVAVAPV